MTRFAQEAPYILALLGAASPSELLAHQGPSAVRARTMALLVQLVLQGARQQPLVLEVENLHWLDPSSVEVLEALVERLAMDPILLLTTYRPGYRPPWLQKSYATQMPLTRLRPPDSRRIAQVGLGPGLVADSRLEAIIMKAGGIPLFLEELARATVEAGTTQLPEMVPATLEAVLAGRIDRLPAAAKHIVQVAAVIGPEVPGALLQEVLGWPDELVRENLACLQAAEFLYETCQVPASVYTFKHVLTQEAAYQALLPRTRQTVHAQVVQIIEERFPTTVATQPEHLAQHYSAAGLSARAVPYWLRAGQQALQRSANPEVVHHLTTGLRPLGALPNTPERAQQELDLQIALAPALSATKGVAAPEVEQTYARARELCRQVGETPQLFATLRGLCRFYQSRGALDTARELAEQLIQLAKRVDAPTLRLEAHDALGSTLFFLGDYAAAWAHPEEGIILTDPVRQSNLALHIGEAPGVRCLAYAALTLWCLGYPAQAARRSQEALALAEELTHPHSLAYALHFATFLHHHRREAPVALALAETLLTLATAQGFPHYVGFGTCWRGSALAMQGQGEAGLTYLRQGLTAVMATGQGLARPLGLLLLAEAAGYAGQVDEGLCILTEALAAFETGRRGDLLAEAYRLQGELFLRRATVDMIRAEDCFRQALAIACRHQAKSWELRAAMSLSRLWQRQGKCAAAYALLAEVYGWFTEGFDTPDLQEAKVLLEELA